MSEDQIPETASPIASLVKDAESLESSSLYKDVSQFHPLLADFEAVEHDNKSVFPYKWIVYGGNYWDTLTKVTRPRGFNLVKTKDDDNLEEINFIWKPIQFSYLVAVSFIISIIRGLIK